MKADGCGAVWPWLLVSLLCVCTGVQSTEAAGPPFKAVNLGGWLVVESFITPRLFDGVPHRKMLDGTEIALQSAALERNLSASDDGTVSFADGQSTSGHEIFKLWRTYGKYEFKLRAFNGLFIGLRDGGGLSLVAEEMAATFLFIIFIRSKKNRHKVHIKVNPEAAGPGMLLQRHWDNFIVEEDFKFIADHGLNAVRIPVGWWTSKDPNPPKPFVGGSLRVLDRAFRWAENYNLKVILDLHAPPYAQNGGEHSGSRDGEITFGKEDKSISETVEVIRFFSERYGNSPNLAAVELLNEPHYVSYDPYADRLKKYYREGYAAVRKYWDAFVIFSDRLDEHRSDELFDLADGRTRVVIDVHFYSMYEPKFKRMTVQKNINYIYRHRSEQLKKITSSHGILSFVGEWVAQFDSEPKPGEEDKKEFAKAQQQVYGRASFGWAYWTYKKDGQDPWSLRWMIDNGYINTTL